jgi:hypothetical protein
MKLSKSDECEKITCTFPKLNDGTGKWSREKCLNNGKCIDSNYLRITNGYFTCQCPPEHPQ